MHKLEVGKPFLVGQTRLAAGVQYNYDGNGHELQLRFGAPSAREVEAIRAGPCDFALAIEGDVLFFLYRFGDAVPWSDAPYSWHLVPRERRQVPPALHSEHARAVLQIILVDAQTGLVRALRAVSLAPEFTAALHAAIARQSSTAWCGTAEYDRQLAEVYDRRLPTTEALLAVASCHTEGGA